MIELLRPIDCVQAVRLSYLASQDATKPNLSGLRLEVITPTRLALAATGGFVLGWAFLDHPEPHGLTQGLTLPAALLKAIKKGTKSRKAPSLTFDPETKELRLACPDGSVSLHQPEPYNYPQWRKVIPGPSNDLEPLTGVKLQMRFMWPICEALADPFNRTYSGPDSIHLTALGMRVGTSDNLVFHRDGLWVLALETRFAENHGPEAVTPESIRAGLTFEPMTEVQSA